MTATETCACGATFTLTARNEAAVMISLKQWREKHQCTVRKHFQDTKPGSGA